MQTFASLLNSTVALSRSVLLQRLGRAVTGLRSTTAQRAVSFARWFA